MFFSRKKIIFICSIIMMITLLSVFFIKSEKKLYFETTDLGKNISAESTASKEKNIQSTKTLHTSCSKEAEQLGLHQKVISYSFLNKKKNYSKGVNEVMQNISYFYPGWKVRIYALPRDILHLKSVMKNWSFVYYCDITNLPPPIFNVTPYPVTMWRFAPLGDDQVDVLLLRDLDSVIIRREYDAVSEWLNSTRKALHIMRDHPHHKLQILGGMWGLRMNDDIKEMCRYLRNLMFEKTYLEPDTRVDQPILKEILWPVFQNNFIAHDSFHCFLYSGSSPFPTRRDKERKFIGDQIFQRKLTRHYPVPKKCPLICRPIDHQDWEYC